MSPFFKYWGYVPPQSHKQFSLRDNNCRVKILDVGLKNGFETCWIHTLQVISRWQGKLKRSLIETIQRSFAVTPPMNNDITMMQERIFGSTSACLRVNKVYTSTIKWKGKLEFLFAALQCFHLQFLFKHDATYHFLFIKCLHSQYKQLYVGYLANNAPFSVSL